LERIIFIAEGEKDANTLRSHGVPATCNPMGAGKWWPEFNDILRGADVVICGDNDEPGRKHVQLIAENLRGSAKRVRILDLALHWPEIEASADISDWFETGGGTAERLWDIASTLPDWTPAAVPQQQQLPKIGSMDQLPVKLWNWRDDAITLHALRSKKFEPISYILPDIVPEGLTLLVGRPKIGKSWLMLDFAIAVAHGRFTLGTIKPPQGDVLFLALEDSKRRIQRRADKLLPTFGEWPERLTIITEWRRTDGGCIEGIEDWCRSVEKPTVVVVDTLAKVRPLVEVKNSYAADYRALTGLQELAGRHPGLGVVVNHHDRKMSADDVFDTVSGTLGLTGAADTILIITRKAGQVTLHVDGRDVEKTELALQFDKATCRWTILGAASEVHRSAERGRILAALEGTPEGLSPSETADITGLTHANARQLLVRMAKDSEIQRVGYGRYFHLTVTPPVTPVTLSPAGKKLKQTKRCADEKSDSDRVTSVTGVTPPLVPVLGGDEPPADFRYPDLPAILDRRARQ
jgi:hypothetical protein